LLFTEVLNLLIFLLALSEDSTLLILPFLHFIKVDTNFFAYATLTLLAITHSIKAGIEFCSQDTKLFLELFDIFVNLNLLLMIHCIFRLFKKL